MLGFRNGINIPGSETEPSEEDVYLPAYPIVAGNSLEQVSPEIARFTEGAESAFELWSMDLDRLEGQVTGHSTRTAALAVGLASHMGLSERDCVHIRHGALLHEIGTLVIPDSIKNKPIALSEEMCLLLRSHPTRGFALTEPIAILGPALSIPLYHHERWDGTGYPFRLHDSEIPVAARIFSVVDSWDTLLHSTSGQTGAGTAQVVCCLQALSGRHFDPEVLSAFFAFMCLNPSGLALQSSLASGGRGTFGYRMRNLWSHTTRP